MVDVRIFGDSILKGIQVNPVNKKYYINNNIDVTKLSEKYSIKIQNYSSFGCTVTKGSKVLKKYLDDIKCDAIVMDYGGNDCDYNWRAISQDPKANHSPNTPIELFVDTYYDIIDTLKKRGIIPILTTLPPLEPQKFFDWFCKDLNKNNIMMWLGEIDHIYNHQESYSKIVEKIALDTQVPLVDLRGDFLKTGDISKLLCEDGTHPNSLGQKVIESSFQNFAKEAVLALR